MSICIVISECANGAWCDLGWVWRREIIPFGPVKITLDSKTLKADGYYFQDMLNRSCVIRYMWGLGREIYLFLNFFSGNKHSLIHIRWQTLATFEYFSQILPHLPHWIPFGEKPLLYQSINWPLKILVFTLRESFLFWNF